ncbi:uncharacterized protein LOC134525029 [Chroicocephalus ridibundus]|uniref:uncharacterized protein LOC134525029 n=1 Tax=Chroicocephalus ridibundus TaxID=1192867 RepID=UPI002FDCEBE3
MLVFRSLATWEVYSRRGDFSCRADGASQVSPCLDIPKRRQLRGSPDVVKLPPGLRSQHCFSAQKGLRIQRLIASAPEGAIKRSHFDNNLAGIVRRSCAEVSAVGKPSETCDDGSALPRHPSEAGSGEETQVPGYGQNPPGPRGATRRALKLKNLFPRHLAVTPPIQDDISSGLDAAGGKVCC